jgi:hypothetical protein
MQTTILTALVSMVRATESGPQEYQPGDSIEVPTESVQRLIERRMAKRPEAAKSKQ